MNAMVSLIQHDPSAVLTEDAGFMPVRVVEIELGRPLPGLLADDEKTGQRYHRALCLVRLHTQPLGLLELQLDENGASASEYVSPIWHALGEKINAHLQ